jgi:hypothetical protein
MYILYMHIVYICKYSVFGESLRHCLIESLSYVLWTGLQSEKILRRPFQRTAEEETNKSNKYPPLTTRSQRNGKVQSGSGKSGSKIHFSTLAFMSIVHKCKVHTQKCIDIIINTFLSFISLRRTLAITIHCNIHIKS